MIRSLMIVGVVLGAGLGVRSQELQVAAEPVSVSPAERKIAAAEAILKADPRSIAAWNTLAMAYARRARECADPAFYVKSREAVAEILKLSPENYEARRTDVWALLGQHEFAKARDAALELKKEFPDDVTIHGYLTDAYVELGSYDKAEEACQWMLDVRPGNVPALTRAAYLREIFGSTSGAIVLMRDAFEQTSISESEDRAWILTQIAHLELSVGRAEAAKEAVDRALALYPGYHYALQQAARIATAKGELFEAVALLRARWTAAPHPENLFDLAVALKRAGKSDESKEAFARFESEAVKESTGADNANHELIWYFADHAGKAEAALELATKECGRRKDLGTRQALAWALFKCGKHDAARSEVDGILAIGIRDAEFLYRAGLIARAQRDHEAARAFFAASLAVNPLSPVAAEARQASVETTKR